MDDGIVIACFSLFLVIGITTFIVGSALLRWGSKHHPEATRWAIKQSGRNARAIVRYGLGRPAKDLWEVMKK